MEDISYTPNFLNSPPPSPENKSILRQLCRPDSHCISRFTAGTKSGWPLKPARSRPYLRITSRLPVVQEEAAPGCCPEPVSDSPILREISNSCGKQLFWEVEGHQIHLQRIRATMAVTSSDCFPVLNCFTSSSNFV